MRLSLRGTLLALVLLAAAGGLAATTLAGRAVGSPSPAVAALHFEPYEAQKVVYHVAEGEGLFERKWKNLLHVARNHVEAVAFGELDLAIILQGGGVDLLKAAAKDRVLASEIDRLKAAGVRFVVCRNTLVLKGIDPAKLHGVTRADIVSSAVAEAVRLAGQGYTVLRF
jgi:intracellular sulfur oxidation DsrE/DsrF family protein